MKKLVFLVVLMIVLSGCSGAPISIPFLPTSVPPASPQPTVTPYSLEPSNTPDLFVLNTLAPTLTPAPGNPIVPIATNTPFPSPTLTPTIRATITLEPINPNLFTPSPNLFMSVQRSTTVIVWGGSCEGARSITFTAQVQPARRLRYVTLWYRLQDKYSGRHTDWGGGAILKDNDQGTYFYTLELGQIQRYRYFLDAWLQYQLVASTVTEKVLGRSVVSQSDVSLVHCSVINP